MAAVSRRAASEENSDNEGSAQGQNLVSEEKRPDGRACEGSATGRGSGIVLLQLSASFPVLKCSIISGY